MPLTYLYNPVFQWLPTEDCPIQTERYQVRCETRSHNEGIEVREIKLALTGDVYMNVADMTQVLMGFSNNI